MKTKLLVILVSLFSLNSFASTAIQIRGLKKIRTELIAELEKLDVKVVDEKSPADFGIKLSKSRYYTSKVCDAKKSKKANSQFEYHPESFMCTVAHKAYEINFIKNGDYIHEAFDVTRVYSDIENGVGALAQEIIYFAKKKKL